MKVLCLHGYGTNAEFLRYQLSGITRNCDPSWEFHFLSGEVECPPASAGLETVASSPFYCWTRSFDPESVRSAYDLIEEAIDDHGPFTGVLGFSQGAAIIASFMLEYMASHPYEPHPFRFAIFSSCTIPCAADPGYCQSLFGFLSPHETQLLRSGSDDQIVRLPEPARFATEEFVKVIKAAASITRQSPPFYLDRPLHMVPGPLLPNLFKARLRLPTLHLSGQTDLPGLDSCRTQVESFCDSKLRRTIQHSGGHDLPRSGPDVNRIVSAMEWVVARSELASQ